MGKQKPGHQQLHHGEQHTEMKTHRRRTPVHTHSSSRHLKGLSAHSGTQQARPQWIQKNICITEKQIPLEGHEEISPPTLYQMPNLRKTQHQNTATEK